MRDCVVLKIPHLFLIFTHVFLINPHSNIRAEKLDKPAGNSAELYRNSPASINLFLNYEKAIHQNVFSGV